MTTMTRAMTRQLKDLWYDAWPWWRIGEMVKDPGAWEMTGKIERDGRRRLGTPMADDDGGEHTLLGTNS